MKTCKRLLSALLIVAMVFSMIPATVLAAPEAAQPTVTAYLSLSHDAAFLETDKKEAVALQKLEVPYFDLANYGLENFYFQSESYEAGALKPENADPAVYNGKVTVLHLMIYATEVLRCGVAPQEAGKGYLKQNNLMAENFQPSGSPGSLYLTSIWGMDSNMNYYVQHAFPIASGSIGSTMDQKLLRENDVVTLGHFSDFMFFQDARAPFNHLEVNGTADLLTLDSTQPVALQVYHDGGGVSGAGTTHHPIDYTLDVYAANAAAVVGGDLAAAPWVKIGTTDATGALTGKTAAEIAALAGGNDVILAVPGQKGTDNLAETIVCAPAAFRLTVNPVASDVSITAMMESAWDEIAVPTAAVWDQPFSADVHHYTLLATPYDENGYPLDQLTFTVESASVQLTGVTVDGAEQTHSGNAFSLQDLPYDQSSIKTIVLTLSDGSAYTFVIDYPFDGICTLDELAVTETPAYAPENLKTVAPAFAAPVDGEQILPFMAFGMNSAAGATYYLWLNPTDHDEHPAQIYVMPGDNVDDACLVDDEFMGIIHEHTVIDGRTRITVIPQDPTKPVTVEVLCESDDQNASITQFFVLNQEAEDEVSYAHWSEVTIDNPTLSAGETRQMSAVTHWIGSGPRETLTWSSDNPGVASVDQTGKVTWNAAGYPSIFLSGKYAMDSCTDFITCTKRVTDDPDLKAADAVSTQIGAIGCLDYLTPESEQSIIDARAAYEALTPAQKELVTNLFYLEDAEQTIADIKARTITVTVNINTQSVADDVTMLGMTALPETQTLSTEKGQTVESLLWQMYHELYGQYNMEIKGGMLTVLGDFGSFGTTEFDTMMANCGIDPVPDIFQYTGWMYYVDGQMPNVGIQEKTLEQNCTVDLRYGVYLSSGTWEQVDFVFLDAYNGLKARIAEASALEAPSAAVTEAKDAAQAVIDAIDAEAGGLWLNYFAAKQTAMTGPGSPTDQLQKADLALANALAGKVTPETITIAASKPALSVGTDYQIPYTVGPEGASQEVTFDTLLGDGCFTVSETGVITPTKASSMCIIQIKSKEAPSVSANFMFTITDPNQAAADVVIKQINALPAADQITLDDFDAVKAAQDAYDALAPEAKALVNNLDKLNAAVAAVSLLRQPAEVNAWWPNFRGSDSNMAIVNAKTPVSPETTELKWNKKLGSGWSAAPSPMIIVNDSLIVMVGSTIYRLSLETGEVLAQGDMVDSIGFGIVIPTYGSGMIFCPLSGGTVQAFDATTLESLWVYQDALGGQPNCPITYADGMIYTGFWNNETAEANYVAIDVRDENAVKTDEAKEAVWTKATKGGYYWAGSVVVGDAVIFGSDDGTSGSEGTGGHLYALNRKTGAVISDLTGEMVGDQRSSIAYSAEKGRIYFTTKGGYLYSAAVDAVTGALSDLKGSKLGSNQSTSTPIVYGNQVYLCCGSGVGGGDTANNFTVCDADTLEQLYVIGMKAYPQCSPLMSTAYLEREGKLYFYLTYNGKPGGITLVKVDPAKTTADGAELVELYDANGFEQYCICSVICDETGTLYYKNDSCNILAVGSKPQPAKFDLDGTSMILGNDLTMNFCFAKSKLADLSGAYAVVTKSYADGRDNLVVTVPAAQWGEYKTDYYKIPFSGIAAKEMADQVSVEIFAADGNALSSVYTDTIRDYALRTLKNPKTTGVLKTVIVDMLNYGAACQTFFKYNANDLATVGAESYQQFATKEVKAENNRTSNNNFVGTTLRTESNLRLAFYFKNVTSEMHAVITFRDHYGKAHSITVPGDKLTFKDGRAIVNVDELAVADVRQMVTCEIFTAENQRVATVTDSVEGYVARSSSDPVYSNIMKFGTSAFAYFHP